MQKEQAYGRQKKKDKLGCNLTQPILTQCLNIARQSWTFPQHGRFSIKTDEAEDAVSRACIFQEKVMFRY